MPKRIQLRPLTKEERTELEKISHSPTRPYQEVQRAQMILLAHEGHHFSHIAEQLGRSLMTIYTRINRFNAEGLSGLKNKPRQGRPSTYTEEEKGQMMAVARTHPDQLGLPFGHWTLDRLVIYLHQTYQIGVSRAQLGRILKAEGLRWYQEKTYFTERPDPQFVEKRGQ